MELFICIFVFIYCLCNVVMMLCCIYSLDIMQSWLLLIMISWSVWSSLSRTATACTKYLMWVLVSICVRYTLLYLLFMKNVISNELMLQNVVLMMKNIFWLIEINLNVHNLINYCYFELLLFICLYLLFMYCGDDVVLSI